MCKKTADHDFLAAADAHSAEMHERAALMNEKKRSHAFSRAVNNVKNASLGQV